MSYRTLLCGALALFGTSALAQVTRSGSGYLLRVHYTKGQVIRLNTVNTVEGMAGAQGKPMSVTLPITVRVLQTVRDKAKLQLTIGAAHMGTSVLNTGKSIEMWVNNRNESDNGGTATFTGAALPSKPVKIGQSWSSAATIPSGMGAPTQQKLNARYTFRGLKTVNGRQVAVLTYTMQGAANGSGTLTLLAKDGTVYSTDARLTVGTGGQGGMHVVTRVTRA